MCVLTRLCAALLAMIAGSMGAVESGGVVDESAGDLMLAKPLGTRNK